MWITHRFNKFSLSVPQGKGVAIIGSAAVKKWEEEEERVKGDKKGKYLIYQLLSRSRYR